MEKEAYFVTGLAMGAGLMYLLDPARGTRRRALVRDQVVHAAHEVEDLGDRLGSRSRHLQNRARGAVAETRARLRPETVEDQVLEGRVRSAIGRAVSNPGAVHVAVDHGRVTLSGPVLEREAEALLASAAAVRGVSGVENRLESHVEPGNVPGLQGDRR